MKVAVARDLHLEFGPLELQNDENADVLVLAGDICVARDLKQRDVYGVMEGTRSSKLHDFFQGASEKFKHVVYVAGNHEHYDGDFATTYTKLKANLAYLTNVYVLDKEVKVIDDVTFVGGTMWSSMNNRDPLTMFHIKSMMNDFKGVDNSNRVVTRKVPLYKKGEDGQYLKDEKGCYIQDGMKHKESPALFSPEDAVEEFEKFTQYLEVVTAFLGKDPKKYVVVTHHTPSFQSVAPYYKADQLMNGGYHSNLDEFIMDKPNIKLWVHGHTHEDFDYMIGETRVVCNPRGYIKYEARAANFKLKVVEV
jgi:Icc-related predicted phosphoesterase